MDNHDAYRVLLPYLWEYEKTEIINHDTIYFFNIAERKKALKLPRDGSRVIIFGFK
jgi:hypothetical protein